MKLLVLGGTEFVGRAVVEEALSRGAEVTVFHRGRHKAPPGVTALLGDRTAPGGLTGLSEGTWDLVIDTWSAAPSAVGATARLLKGRIGRYAYVSSRSVYPQPVPSTLDETGPVIEASPEAEDVGYPEAKRGGELAVVETFGEDSLLLRCGLVLGPGENVGRLPWWLRRIARAGRVPAPGPRDLGVQYIDARDLAGWTLDAAEAGLTGPYNISSPVGHCTMGDILDACVEVTGSDADLCWVGPDTIAAAGIQPWTDLPLWLPPGELHETMHRGNVAKAVSAGLRCRPVRDTVADTWAWLQRLGGPAPQRADRPRLGLDPAMERALLSRAALTSQ
ncbi:NAD-dependent epimerase/dehydratase family protein [Streptomyces heilongjiangensis]|uniref:NAD-dependent epimerase/dehydratase family protein n=1 Tax=Streptomyces heilongjiangensis TaxID=945052 RepID=A0ABW1AZ43_9ACTN|nr:NAD-dependent epimerase/dehydratase family protein [Streptomyces heilongjiangensis]MDC2947929.1 reductase [Streptomyces heilongjiangensis]